MSQRPGSFVNAAGILASDNPADVVRKLDAAWEESNPSEPEINLLRQAAAALREYRSCQGNGWPPAGFDAHVADLLSRIDASPEGCSTIAASDLVDTILNCQPLVHINSSTRLWEVLHAAGLSVSDQPKFFETLLAARTDA